MMIVVDLWPLPTANRIDLGEEPAFDLGGMRVIPAERAVTFNGERRELQPRVMQVLVALAKARPDVVSRDKLIELCWEGRVVGDDSLNRCILALRHVAQDFTPAPFAIDTVPRIGHRLVEGPIENGQPVASPIKTKRRPWAAAAALLVVIFAAGIFMWQQRSGAAEPASIAVLPFRNLSNDKAYFAEGVGEEILNQLAREPEFRVAGRATAAQFGSDSDPRKIGRALGVDYILEGSVRSDRGRVRVNASLVQTKDGMRLWSESYDGKSDDILQIQSAIGQAVGSGLRRSLVHSPGKLAVNGQAYALYLNARGILRSGYPQAGKDAELLLRQAIRMDPNFAPLWSSLSEALQLNGRVQGPEGMIAVVPEAYGAARRAMQLDPRNSEAHAQLATLLGWDSRPAVAHFQQAAALAPRTGEGFIARGRALEVSGQYVRGLEAYKRAHAVDPAWPLPVRILVDVNSSMGDRKAAEAIVRSGLPDDPMAQSFALARVAWFFGDFSEAARRWSLVAKDPASRWNAPSKTSLRDALITLRLSDDRPARNRLAFPGKNRFFPRLWIVDTPSSAEWQKQNRTLPAALVYQDDNFIAAKLLLNAGRARELVATYDRPTGFLGLRRGEPVQTCQLHEAALLALALKAVGRDDEADELLRQADKQARAVYRQGTVPTWYEEDAAAVWSVQGRSGPAVEALERAFRRGWIHGGRLDLPSIADEPAFRPLRGNAKFEALRTKYEQHYAKERAETAKALDMVS